MALEAIVLVAGMGTRLKPLTLHNHKCLTEVNGTPILKNTLRNLEAVGCGKVIPVVGYLKSQIRNRIGDSFGKVRVVYAENDEYETTNTTASLEIGLEHLSGRGETVLLEGDVFFEQSILEALLKGREKNVTVVEKYKPQLDGTFVEIGSDGYVTDWRHKSQQPKNYMPEGKYKTVNIHKFSSEFIKDILRPYLSASLKEFGGKEPLENVMMRIVRDHPHLIRGMILQGQKWVEIDDRNDLRLAEKIFS